MSLGRAVHASEVHGALAPCDAGDVGTRPRQPATGTRAARAAILAFDHRYALDLDQQRIVRRGARGASAVRAITSLQAQILYWGLRSQTIASIARRVARTEDEVLAAIAVLRRDRIITLRHRNGTELVERALAQDRRHAHTLARLWRQQRRRHAKHPYMVFGADGVTVSYAQAGALVDAVAARLCAQGVRKGDRVAVLAAPQPEAVLVLWAAMTIGAIFVPINSELPIPAHRALLERCAPKIAFAEPRCAEALGEHIPWVALDAPSVGSASSWWSSAFAQWLGSGARSASVISSPVEDDPAVILFTSGSTGMPKGVVLSQGALYRSARLVASIYDLDASDVILSPGEFHSMSGLRNPILAGAAAGASFVLTTALERQHPLAAAELVRRLGVTLLSVVPMFLKILATATHRVTPGALASVRCILTTAATLPPTLAARLRSLTEAPVCDYYGLTETCGGCVFVASDEHGRAAGTIGRPRGVIAQVVDEQERLVPAGVVGELRIYSENVMSGYYREPELTATILRDGWLYTGDLASRRADGLLVLHGRRRDVIKDARGDLICLGEIECVLEQEEAVAEAAVCGHQDAQGEERLAAFIRPATTVVNERALVDLLRQLLATTLGARRVPQRFIVVADFPRCANRKIDKERLVSEHLGHREA
jgi:acyl-coenzyme A synthetase/AMP-(fatty) acid ligase